MAPARPSVYICGLAVEVIIGAWPDPEGSNEAATVACCPVSVSNHRVRDIVQRQTSKLLARPAPWLSVSVIPVVRRVVVAIVVRSVRAAVPETEIGGTSRVHGASCKDDSVRQCFPIEQIAIDRLLNPGFGFLVYTVIGNQALRGGVQ